MKTWQILITIIGIAGFLCMSFFIYYQNVSFQRELDSNKEKIAHLNSTLSNYKSLFGEIQDNYTFTPISLQLQVYVSHALDTNPVQTIEVNQPYMVIAQVKRMVNDPLIYYYCIVDVKNEKNEEVAEGWGHQTMIPKQSSSQCGARWIPTIQGNYTISAFAWQDWIGDPKAEASTSQVQVVSSNNADKISLMYTNGTYTGFPISYTITGDKNKLLNATTETNTKYLVLSLDTPRNGTLTVTIPRVLFDSKTASGNDDHFFVLADGQEIMFNEIKKTSTERTLSIPFAHGVGQMEIFGEIIP